jgi:hypothetical protein
MPAAIPLVVAGLIASEVIVATGMAAFLWMAGASVVSGLLQQSMAKKSSGGAGGTVERGGFKLPTRSSQEPHRVVYGQYKLAGNEVFIEATGADNTDLWLVYNFAEGEVEGIVEIDSVPQVFLDDRLSDTYGGKAEFWFHPGTASQTVDTNLSTAVPKWTDSKRHTAYGVFKLQYDRTYFSGKPLITLLLKGRKLYDIRTAATAWSDNPVLAAYDWFVSTRYGLGNDPALVDLPSWISAANYCDLKGWHLNLVIADRGRSFDILEDILRHFRGEIIWSGGKYVLRYSDLNYESVAMVIDDNHIIQAPGGKSSIVISQASQFGRADGLLVKFVDAAKGYSVDDLNVGESLGVVNEMSLLGSTDKAHVGEIATYFLERGRLDRSLSGGFRDDCVGLESHDLVDFSCTAKSIANQLLRVQQKDRAEDGTVSLVFAYEDEALYNHTYDADLEGVYTCTLPDRTTPPPEVGNIQIVEQNYSFRLRTFTRLIVNYALPAGYPWFDRVEVWISLDAGATYTHQFDSTGTGFNLDPVEEGSTYYLRLISVAMGELRAPLNQAPVVSHTVLGRNDAPESLASLEVIVGENSSIRAYSAQVSDQDVELYEFRLGLSWSSATFLASLSSPNLPLPGVKPGNHTLFCNTKSSNGLYGDTPRSAYVSLIDPPDHWAVQDTETGDYTSGTFTNTEMVEYSGANHLKCSHTAGNLTGSYLSPVIDLGASGRYLAYILADLVVTGEGQTWGAVVPGATTWAELDVTRKWREIFQSAAAPTVRCKLWYGDTNPPTNTVERLEILSAIVEGRYYQVEIEIIDPSLTINALVEGFTLKFCQ